jgi:hypothetical protein
MRARRIIATLCSVVAIAGTLGSCCASRFASRSPQVVEIGPLRELPERRWETIRERFPQWKGRPGQGEELDLVFHSRWDQDEEGSPREVRIILTAFATTEKARSAFDNHCDKFGDRSGFEVGGSGDDRYCVSYVARLRSVNAYWSFVVFQKQNLLVEIDESSRTAQSTAKSGVIAEVAAALD